MNFKSITEFISWKSVILGPLYELKVICEHIDRAFMSEATRYVRICNAFFALMHIAVSAFVVIAKSVWFGANLQTLIYAWVLCSSLYIATFMTSKLHILDSRRDPDTERELDLIGYITNTLRALVAGPATVFFVSVAMWILGV